MSCKGVILCGGLSTRMMEDKGSKEVSGITFLEIVLAEMSLVCDDVLISVSEKQKDVYSERFPDLELIVDQDLFKGPINGIASCHLAYPENDLLVVPCDMLKVKASNLNVLIGDVSLCYSSGGIQPFPLFIKCKDLNILMKADLQKYSMKSVIEQLEIGQEPSYCDDFFFNANYPKDVARIEKKDSKNRKLD